MLVKFEFPKCKKKQKQRLEFSKKIIIAAGALNFIVIMFSLYMIWKTENLEPLVYLIPSTAAEVATGTGFYYAKAKAENKIKLMKENGIPITGQDFNEENGGVTYEQLYLYY